MSPILGRHVFRQNDPDLAAALEKWKADQKAHQAAFEVWKTQNPEAFRLSQIPEPGWMGSHVEYNQPAPVTPPTLPIQPPANLFGGAPTATATNQQAAMPGFGYNWEDLFQNAGWKPQF
jgi:hypothetical protein